MLCLGTEAEGVRGEEMQEEEQVLLDERTDLVCLWLVSAERLLFLLFSSGRLFIHDVLQFPTLVHKM